MFNSFSLFNSKEEKFKEKVLNQKESNRTIKQVIFHF